VGKLCATVPVIAARALEQFLEELITKSASITVSLSAKTLTPEHIRTYILEDPRLSFLHDLANRTATGPNSGRSLSTSSSMPPPTTTTTTIHRHSFQQQLSIPYQDPTSLSSATSTLYVNQQLSRSFSDPFYAKVASGKRSFDLVEEEDDDDDDDDEGTDDSYLVDHTAT
jgi:hypothetical protein